MIETVQEYLRAIARYPLLTPQQEIQLSRQVQLMRELQTTPELTPEQRRTVKRGEKARSTIINCNLRLVVHVAKRYQTRLKGGSMELMDLIQEGSIGLHRAAEMFDGTKGYKFSTYAYWWIRQAITRAIDTQERLIRVPQHSLDKIYKAARFQREYSQEHGKPATTAQMAEFLGISIKEMNMLISRNMTHTSLDALATEDGTPLLDFVADEYQLEQEHTSVEQSERIEQLQLAFFRIDPNDRNIVAKRYGLDGTGEMLTYQAIGNQLGVSRERIRQRLSRAHNRLRYELWNLKTEKTSGAA